MCRFKHLHVLHLYFVTHVLKDATKIVTVVSEKPNTDPSLLGLFRSLSASPLLMQPASKCSVYVISRSPVQGSNSKLAVTHSRPCRLFTYVETWKELVKRKDVEECLTM
jgi:hypothetical protein